MGDFNARTGSLNDFVELDETTTVDYDLLPSNYLEDIDLSSRQNVDQTVNVKGKHLLDICIESKLQILNGRIFDDSLGYTTVLTLVQGEVALLIVLSFLKIYLMPLIL